MASALHLIRNLSIRRKMILGFAAVIVLVGLGNLYGIVSMGQVADESLFSREVAFRKVARLTDVENMVKRIVDSAATGADVGIPEPLAQAGSLRREFERTARAANTEFRSDGALGRDLDELVRRVDEHLRRADALLKLAVDRRWSEFGAPRKEFEEGRNLILQQIAATRGRCVQELEGSLLSIARVTKRTASSTAGATGLVLVVALLIAVYLSGEIVRPLQRLTAMMKRAQDGDISVRASVESQDETGALSKGFNEMLEELQGHRQHLEELVEERTAQLEVVNGKLQTELEVRQITEAALAESEELVRNVLNAVNAGIMIVDAERHEVLEANPFALKLIGARREEVVGHQFQDYLCASEPENTLLSKEARTIQNVKSELRRADGGCLPIIRSAVPIMHQGRTHLIESFIDVAEAQ